MARQRPAQRGARWLRLKYRGSGSRYGDTGLSDFLRGDEDRSVFLDDIIICIIGALLDVA